MRRRHRRYVASSRSRLSGALGSSSELRSINHRLDVRSDASSRNNVRNAPSARRYPQPEASVALAGQASVGAVAGSEPSLRIRFRTGRGATVVFHVWLIARWTGFQSSPSWPAAFVEVISSCAEMVTHSPTAPKSGRSAHFCPPTRHETAYRRACCNARERREREHLKEGGLASSVGPRDDGDPARALTTDPRCSQRRARKRRMFSTETLTDMRMATRERCGWPPPTNPLRLDARRRAGKVGCSYGARSRCSRLAGVLGELPPGTVDRALAPGRAWCASPARAQRNGCGNA
jgi:hypothetical protein